jgi:TM2 domain-containing membrane protein YozV
MRRNSAIAGLLSLVVPGLGQIYAGRSRKGAIILVTAIIIGNLNLLLLTSILAANPDPGVPWAVWIPRIGHDVLSLWSIVFWMWVVVDAVRTASVERASEK